MSAESPSQIKFAWIIGILAAFTVFAAVGAYSSRMADEHTDFYEQQGVARFANLQQLQHDEQALLHPVDSTGHPTADWVDQEKKTVRIPIEEAMGREVDALKSKAPQVGAPLPPPPAPSAPAGTNAAPTGTNAAPAGTNAAPAATNAPSAKPKK